MWSGLSDRSRSEFTPISCPLINSVQDENLQTLVELGVDKNSPVVFPAPSLSKSLSTPVMVQPTTVRTARARTEIAITARATPVATRPPRRARARPSTCGCRRAIALAGTGLPRRILPWLSFSGSEDGFGRIDGEDCTVTAKEAHCTEVNGLYFSADGGESWKPTTRPGR